MMVMMTTRTDEPGTDTGSPTPRARVQWPTLLLALGGAVSMLLLGAAAGMLLLLPGAEEVRAPEPDSVNVGFAQDMSVHHEQAVTMASWARDHSTDPVIRQLAYDIEATQRSQIGRMQGWLELWNASAYPIGDTHMAWMDEGAGHAHGGDHGGAAADGVSTMPGMASTEDLRRLRAASGPQLDVLFLQLMLRHHTGGTSMLEYAAENASVSQVSNLAEQMLRSQTGESDYLRTLLAERGAAPLPL